MGCLRLRGACSSLRKYQRSEYTPMAITGPVIVSMDLVKEQKILLAPRTIGVRAAYYDTAMLKVNQSDVDALGNSFSIMYRRIA